MNHFCVQTILSFFLVGLFSLSGNANSACGSLFESSLFPAYGQNRDVADQYFHLEYEPTKVLKVETGASSRKVEPEFQSKRTDRMNIEVVMKDFSLTKLQATEVQALLRRYVKYPRISDIQSAVAAVKAGQTLSRLNIPKVSKAKFVLVLDIDGTLLDQDAGFYLEGSHSSSFLVDGTKMHHVALNPGALNAIRRSKELGGAVVLFSRNNDRLIWEILSSTEIAAGTTLADVVDGVFTSSHMTVAKEVSDRVGTEDLMNLLKKDLSIIPNKRVLLIDDDAQYVLQQNAMIEVPKFDLERFYRSVRRTESRDDLSTDSRDEFGYSRSSKKVSDMSPAEKKAILDAIESFNGIYGGLIKQIEFLVSNLKNFSELQKVFSPRGEIAVELLTDQHERYYIPNVKKVTQQQALAMLIADPKLIEETIAKKKRRREQEPNDLGFSFSSFLPRLLGR